MVDISLESSEQYQEVRNLKMETLNSRHVTDGDDAQYIWAGTRFFLSSAQWLEYRPSKGMNLVRMSLSFVVLLLVYV